MNSSTSIGEKTVFKKNQVLYSKLRPYLKKVLIADEDGISTSELISFDVFGGIIEKYIVFCLTNSFVDKMINNRSYGVKMPRVDAGFMVNLPIPVPPLAEQKRIVQRVEEIFRVLDTIDEAQEKYYTNLEILKAKLITVGIQGKLTEQLDSDGTAEELYQQIQEEKQKLIKDGKIKKEKPLPPIKDEEIPFEIPSYWKWVRLGELSKIVTKGSSPKWQGVNYTDSSNGILFVTSENVGTGRMLLDKRKYVEEQFNEMHPVSILQKGDILINIVGASIGRTAVFDEDTDTANINQAVCIARLVNYKMADYILRYLCSNGAIKLMLGKVIDTARANLSLTSVSNLIIPLPPLAEQKRIAEKLEGILSLFEILK